MSFEGGLEVLMCRRAVDLGKGQLMDLTLEYLGNMELIGYIVHRSSNLKRPTLGGCYDIYGECLSRAVEKLPELEELHLTIMPEDVRAIGLACPKLKSFSYNGPGFKQQWPYQNILDEYNPCDHALAISKSMPNLQHLQLVAQMITNTCLEAILDACSHLESLDLRQCYDLDLSGDLGMRCREQIKDLRFPLDSASDIQHLFGGPCDWVEYWSL